MSVRRAPSRIEATSATTKADMADRPLPRTESSKMSPKPNARHHGTGISKQAMRVAAPDAAPVAPLAPSKGVHQIETEKFDALKAEFNLIRDVMDRTKQEVASFNMLGQQFGSSTDVNGELDAVMGGIEQATQRILDAAEAIDQSLSAITKVDSAEQRQALCNDVSERVISIFEACNFQDLAGQRISKVMKTMKFIDSHMNVMTEIWGSRDAVAGEPVDSRDEQSRLLNGPKLPDAIGHVSQNDIDSLFD